MLGTILHIKNCLEENIHDFSGQDLAYKIQERLVVLTGIMSFIIGFYHQKFYYTVLTTLLGLAITLLVCVPSWPMYCRNKVNWLPSENREEKKKKREADKQE
ncbi:Microsomal signal peptidase subunit(SPC12) [Cryptosporidium tyzzeri]|nr:Microsomal signal peptidase subunit(SPC12) [Cryptosporidium tyzzeri]